MKAQQPEGWFPCYCASAGGNAAPKPFEGGAFTHGAVGEALLLAERVTGDSRYLAAASRAAKAYRLYPWEDNQNYAAFALWHLAELYMRDRSPLTLGRAVYYASHFAARGIDLSGAQDGHNYYTGYSNITLKGLARLLEVLPSGMFAGRNRKYLGYHHTAPGLFFVARALPEMAADLEPALLAMYEAQKGGPDLRHSDTAQYCGMTIACMAQYVAEQSGGR